MKITLYYENKNHTTVLDVPDEELNIMVENDYQQRLDAAEDKSFVCHRSPQEIMDKEFNEPTYNKNRAETRPHKYTGKGCAQMEADVPFGARPEYIDLYRAIEKLQKQQQELVRKIFWEGIKQVEIARADGVDEAAVSRRMARIYKQLKKILKK